MLILRLLLPCLLPALLSAEPAKWPREFKQRPVKAKVASDAASGNIVADTPHVRIESETKINRPDLDRFATVVESVPSLIEQFPLPLWAPPKETRISIFLCADEDSFRKLGGFGGAAGWYDGRTKKILLLGDYFLRPPALHPTRLQPRPHQDILVHEILHRCMDGILWRTPPWLHEGIAEYFSACHKTNGYYTFHDIERTVRDKLRVSVTIEKDGTLHLLPVADILGYNSKGWIEASGKIAHGNPYLPYATALLLTHYHFNGGTPRREKTAEYFAGLHKLTRRDRTPPFPAEDAKLIQDRLVKFWGPKGLNLVFEQK